MDFFLNGNPVSVDAADGESLLEVLRERLGVTSVKDGCAPEGSCGRTLAGLAGRECCR